MRWENASTACRCRRRRYWRRSKGKDEPRRPGPFQAATTSIPIIFFTGFAPVASGFVASLNRQGGNVTGISVLNTEVLAKRLQMLCGLVPTAKSVAFLYSPTNLVSGQDRVLKDLESAADALGVKLMPVEAQR